MSPAIQEAYNKWADSTGIEGILSTYTPSAFEAGWNASIAEAYLLEHGVLMWDASSTPAGSTPVPDAWADQINLEKAGLISYDAKINFVGPEPEHRERGSRE